MHRSGDVPLAKVADRFMAKLNELEEAGGAAPPPILLDGSLSYVYVQYSNLYLLAVTQGNVNAAATLVFLHKLIEIFKHYFHEVRWLLLGLGWWWGKQSASSWGSMHCGLDCRDAGRATSGSHM